MVWTRHPSNVGPTLPICWGPNDTISFFFSRKMYTTNIEPGCGLASCTWQLTAEMSFLDNLFVEENTRQLALAMRAAARLACCSWNNYSLLAPVGGEGNARRLTLLCNRAVFTERCAVSFPWRLPCRKDTARKVNNSPKRHVCRASHLPPWLSSKPGHKC